MQESARIAPPQNPARLLEKVQLSKVRLESAIHVAPPLPVEPEAFAEKVQLLNTPDTFFSHTAPPPWNAQLFSNLQFLILKLDPSAQRPPPNPRSSL